MEPLNSSSSGRPRIYILTAFVVVVGVIGVSVAIWGTFGRPKLQGDVTPQPAVTTSPTLNHVEPATRQQVVHFCGDCHVLPAAEHFPKTAWHHEVQRGFQFYNDSGRTDLTRPPLASVVAYYQADAPDKLVIPPVVSSTKASPVKFRKAGFPTGDDPDTPALATISAVHWMHRNPDAAGELFCSDMRRGEILKVELGPDSLKAATFANVPHPAAIRVCDLDGDRQTELVIADLGSFPPEDHELGAVWWFRANTSPAAGVQILSGIGRVADVQPVDVDGDGDQDLIVAEFGWHKTGGIHLLENQGMSEGRPKFAPHVLDKRSGTIHVPIADLNGDGRPDFVALISQEHESVVGFLNRGERKFEAQVFDVPQDPSTGSSGLSLVDLDKDGDLDALVTNGDSFDSFYVKPAHGVQWLENRGDLKFVRHRITPMPGVHRALAGDLDGDGDLDIVAAAFLPKEVRLQQPDTEFDSLILLEQTKPGQFERHALETGQCQHTALEMADFDGDGDLDLAVANFTEVREDNLPPVTVWWNLKTDKAVP